MHFSTFPDHSFKKVINSGVKWSKVEFFYIYLHREKSIRVNNESYR
jgi:hypothetical protein